ncbi:hypothetical protein ACFORO_36185 [Amycolatopsis halotolerans]|uniref:Uncharacterized protein n=1 Tax=Amycolatopsis halotolerans TaxID=330083 RepID=A0ABV7QRW7_9PSEU
MTSVRSALGLLCDLISEPPARLTREQEAKVQEIVALARAGEPIRPRVNALLLELDLRPPDGYRGARLLGAVGGHPVPQSFACPTSECVRRWTRRPGEDPPLCVVSGRLLEETGGG